MRVSCFDERNGADAPFGQEILSTVRTGETGYLGAYALVVVVPSGGVDVGIKAALNIKTTGEQNE